MKIDTCKSWQNILKKISTDAKGIDRQTGMLDLNHISFIGNFGLIKREVFEKINGFPTIYKGWGMEDTHLMYSLCLNNYDYGLFGEKGIKVYHLNHTIENHASFVRNYKQFKELQKANGILFNEAAFFNEASSIEPVLSPIK